MARRALPRFTADVVVTVEVAASTADDALVRLDELVNDAVRPAVDRAVRNHRGRTARVIGGRILVPARPA